TEWSGLPAVEGPSSLMCWPATGCSSNPKRGVTMAGQFGAAFALTLILCLDSGWAAETSSESKIVAAIYKQVFRHAPNAERLWNYSYELQSGKTVKEIVKELCSTKEFIHIVTQGSTSQGLTTCFDRILGRPPTTEELQRYAE